MNITHGVWSPMRCISNEKYLYDWATVGQCFRRRTLKRTWYYSLVVLFPKSASFMQTL